MLTAIITAVVAVVSAVIAIVYLPVILVYADAVIVGLVAIALVCVFGWVLVRLPISRTEIYHIHWGDRYDVGRDLTSFQSWSQTKED
jgi:hypothetical protein